MMGNVGKDRRSQKKNGVTAKTAIYKHIVVLLHKQRAYILLLAQGSQDRCLHNAAVAD